MELQERKSSLALKCWKNYHKQGTKMKGGKRVNNCVPNESIELTPEEMFDLIESVIEEYALEHDIDSDDLWESAESVSDEKLFETAAWRRSEGKNKNGGLNAKGVASYRKEHPGSKLQTAVTTPPSKLDPDSRAAKRRKSFCARMGGMPGPMKDEHGKPTRKALSLKKWNC